MQEYYVLRTGEFSSRLVALLFRYIPFLFHNNNSPLRGPRYISQISAFFVPMREGDLIKYRI